jgi:hypothetical protein
LGYRFSGCLDSAVHKQDPDRALIGAAIIIPGGSDRQIRDPVIIKIACTGDRRAELIVGIQVAVKSPRVLGNYLPAINLAIRLHRQDPDRARVVGTVIIIGSAYRQIPDPIAAHVPDIGKRTAETVIIIEIPVKAAGTIRYVLLLQNPAPGIEKQYPDAPRSVPPSSLPGAPTARSGIPSLSRSPIPAIAAPK